MLVIFTNVSLKEFQVKYFVLFLSNVRFWMGSLDKNIQLMWEFLKVIFLVLHFSYSILMTFLMMLTVKLLSLLMILPSTLSMSRHLWQELEMAFGLESDLQDTVDWGRKWLVDFRAGKTQFVLFDWSSSSDAIDVKMDRSVRKEKLYFKILGLSFSSKLNWGSYIVSIAKTVAMKI